MRPRPARSERWPNACRSPVAQRCWTGRSRPPRGIGDDWAKAGALGSLAARLPEELLDRALTAAEEIGDAKATVLETLAERLPEPRRTERCWTGRSRPPRGIGDDWAKAGALGLLAERL